MVIVSLYIWKDKLNFNLCITRVDLSYNIIALFILLFDQYSIENPHMEMEEAFNNGVNCKAL